MITILPAGNVPADNLNTWCWRTTPMHWQVALEGVDRVVLNFPKFTDGRAFSQARLLRRRRGFTGDIRATGDVLIDQLVQM
jgi:uncharacterized protein (DUF934 family)